MDDSPGRPFEGSPPALRFGPYTIRSQLGRGAMGAVCLAVHRDLGRQVALKILKATKADDPMALERFRREARLAVGLSHPTLVQVYDFGIEGEWPYIAMEYVRGRTLQEIVSSGPMGVDEVARIVRELLSGLDACHRAGVTHRDLKPANVMLEASGRVRILDLGLARQVDRTIITEQGFRIGSPRYMAPEMIVHGTADARSDLYQVGLIAHECLTGRPAFPEKHIPTLLKLIVNEPPPPLSPATGPLEPRVHAVIGRLLEKDPARRFESAGEALAALEDARPPRNAPFPPPAARCEAASLPPASGRPGRRTIAPAPVLVALIAGLLLIVVGRSALRPPPADTASVPARPGSGAGGPGPRTVGASAVSAPAAPSKVADLKCEVGPTWITATFVTSGSAVVTMRIAPSGPTTTDPEPSLRHRLELRGLEPDTGVDVRLKVHGGLEVTAFQGKTLSVERVASMLAKQLGWASDPFAALDVFHPLRDGGPVGAQFGNELQGKCRKWAAAPDARFWVRAWESIRDRVDRGCEATPKILGRLVRAIARLEDLDRVVRTGFGLDPGLPTSRLGWPRILTKRPDGLRLVTALRFGDGGLSAGRTPLSTQAGVVVVEPPATFSGDRHDFVSTTVLNKERHRYVHAAPWGPCDPGDEPFLRFRVAGGTPLEKLVIQFCHGTKEYDLVHVRPPSPDHPLEGWVRVDPRLLGQAGTVRLVGERLSGDVAAEGISCDHVALEVRRQRERRGGGGE